MTLLIDDRVPGQPGVHALLVGAGRYPHLGPNHDLGQFAPEAGFEQLTSPLHSVEALADWLQKGLRVPDTPLRTLRVLGSSSTRDTPWPSSEPTIANIQQYIYNWFDDVDGHEDNLALFYFCGHGLRVGDVHSILAQDFGENKHDPFQRAIEPDKFAASMRQAKARRQIYLIDACSTSVELPKQYADITPLTGIAPVSGNNFVGKQMVFIRASEFGTKAYGVKDRPSVFMTSFLEAMKGAGSRKAGPTQWVINTDRLKVALDWLVRRLDHGQGQEVSYGGGFSASVDFHELQGEPHVPVQVECDPPDYEDFSCLQVDQVQHCGSGTSPWNVDLAFGKHDFEAVESGAQGRKVYGKTLAEPVFPPYTLVSIPCGDQS